MRKSVKARIEEEQRARWNAMELRTKAWTLNSESEEYLRVKQELEDYMQEAVVDDIVGQFLMVHAGESDLNIFLPIVIAARINKQQMASEAMLEFAKDHPGDLEGAMKAFLGVRKNSSPKTFFEEYRAVEPSVTKEKVIATVEKINDEAGRGRVFSELWIDTPIEREEAEQAGKEAIAEFGKRYPEAMDFLKKFRYQISDLSIEEMFDCPTGETIECDKGEIVEILHRKVYESREELIENEIENLKQIFKEWTEGEFEEA